MRKTCLAAIAPGPFGFVSAQSFGERLACFLVAGAQQRRITCKALWQPLGRVVGDYSIERGIEVGPAKSLRALFTDGVIDDFGSERETHFRDDRCHPRIDAQLAIPGFKSRDGLA